MKNILTATIALTLFALSSSAFAVPDDSAFLPAKKRKRLVLRDCSLIDTATKALVENRRDVSVRGTQALKQTDSSRLDRRYRLFACAQSDADPTKTALWAKATSLSTPVEFTFESSDFPEVENNLGSACSRILPFSGGLIYKTLGSTHFPLSDCRRNTSSIIATRSGPRAPSCVDVLDSEGNVIAKMGGYYPAGAYNSRNYACYGCGRSTPYGGRALASRARANTNSTDIYFDFGSVCYGPVNASVCRNSSQC